jgi:hypothetical protein
VAPPSVIDEDPPSPIDLDPPSPIDFDPPSPFDLDPLSPIDFDPPPWLVDDPPVMRPRAAWSRDPVDPMECLVVILGERALLVLERFILGGPSRLPLLGSPEASMDFLTPEPSSSSSSIVALLLDSFSSLFLLRKENPLCEGYKVKKKINLNLFSRAKRKNKNGKTNIKITFSD